MHMQKVVVHLNGLRALGPDGLPLPHDGRCPTERRVLRSLFRTLEDKTLCSLATVNPNGQAHICPCVLRMSSGTGTLFLVGPQFTSLSKSSLESLYGQYRYSIRLKAGVIAIVE